MNAFNYMKYFFGNYVCLHITRKCNLRCPYCNTINQPYPDVDFDTWSNEIEYFDDFKIRNISVQGGEPTEYPELFEVLRCIKRRSKAMVSVVTNGCKIMDDPAYRKELSKLVDVLVISINSLSGLTKLGVLSKDFKIIIVNTIIHSQNIRAAPDMVREVSNHKNCFLNFMIMYVDDNLFSTSKNKEFLPPLEEMIQTSKELMRLKVRGYPILGSFGYLKRMPDYVKGWRWKCDPSKVFRSFALNNDARIMVCEGTKPLMFLLSDLKKDRNMIRFKEDVRRVVDNCAGCLFDNKINNSISKFNKFLDYIPLIKTILK